MKRIGQLITLVSDKPWLYFIGLWLLLFILYLPSIDAKFVSDYMQWAARYESIGFSGIAQSFDDVSLKYGYHLLMYSGYKIFGWNAVLWHILMTGIHALNAVFLLIFIKKLLSIIGRLSLPIPLLASLLFAFSPFHTETIVWAAAIHFLVMPLLILSSLHCYLRYAHNGDWRYVVCILLLFMAGLYTTEAIIVLPMLILLLSVFISSIGVRKWSVMLGDLYKVIVPLLLTIAAFLYHTKIEYGNAIGHYGADTHLNIQMTYIVGNLIKYHLKFLLFFPLLPVNHFHWMAKMEGVTAILLSVVWILFVVWAIVRAIRHHHKFSLMMWLLYLCAVISLLPVINLENQSIHSVQTDRYSYIASLFFYGSIVLFVFHFNKWIRYVLFTLFGIVSLYGLWYNVQVWSYNGSSFQHLVKSFPIEGKGESIYILSMNDSYKGAYQFRNGLKQALEFNHAKPLNADILTFGYINALAPNDSIRVTPQGDKYSVIVGDWGRWFQIYGNGTIDANIVFENQEGTFEYHFRFVKPLESHDKVIYQSGNHWRDVTHLFDRE